MTIMTGLVERITYRSEDTLYTVFRLGKGDGESIVATGTLPSIQVGEEVELQGDWVNHPAYGAQFKASSYRVLPPKSLSGVERYLGSGLIKGVGPAMAKRIVDKFGMDALAIIEASPERLEEIGGIGRKTRERIAEAVAGKRDIERIMVFLQGHGVNTGVAVRIHKQYGSDAMDIVASDPYRLCDEVWGIGFVTADRIAQSMGFPEDSPKRIGAGLFHALGQLANDGHSMAPRDVIEAEAVRLLACEGDLVRQALDELITKRGLIEDREFTGVASPAVYLPSLYQCERGIAVRLGELCLSNRAMMDFSLEEDLTRFEEGSGAALSDDQRNAVMRVFKSSVVVITGGPGTGKTTTLKALVDLFGKRSLAFALTAPTGRAAKRITEATGREAKTIHRLLEFSPDKGGSGSFLRNEGNPLEVDAVIIDEASMIDTPLMYHLLKSIPVGARVVVVGDTDQLPSVGPGNVLRDTIESGAVDTVRLTEVFRQAAGSLIVTNAHRINKGIMPVTNVREGDFFLLEAGSPEETAATVTDLMVRRLPAKYGFNPMSDIQVLCPMRLHATGVDSLNPRIQEALNPPRTGRPGIRNRACEYRVGDRVMQTVNDYEKDVFNGDMGVVVDANPDDRSLTVRFSDRDVPYDHSELDGLTLSYAVSIHKSQGSEYPCVIIPLTTQHYRMLKRNLLYTAVTRAKRLAVIVGSANALSIAVGRNDSESRHTLLAPRIRKELGLV